MSVKIPLISIIVPVYNIEKYLPQCLNSIFNQSLDISDFEVIAVNDCSQGNCKEIMEEYKKKYDNIRLINHEYNKGLYQARRTGIFNSNGKYIMHVDGDDYLSLKEDNKYFLKNVINKLDSSNADILFFDCIHTDGEKEWKDEWFKAPNSLKNNEEVIKYFYGNGCHTMWCKIYRKSILYLAYNDLPDIENISLFEDMFQNIFISYYAKSTITINEDFYYYRYLEESDSRRLRKTKEEKENVIYQITSILKAINDFMETKSLYKNYGYLFLNLLEQTCCYRGFCLYNELEYSITSREIYNKNKIDWIYKIVPSDMIKNAYIQSVKNLINNKDILIEKSKSYFFSVIIFEKHIIIRICGIDIKLKNKNYCHKPMAITLSNLLQNIFSVKIDDKYFVLKILFIKLSFKLRN